MNKKKNKVQNSISFVYYLIALVLILFVIWQLRQSYLQQGQEQEKYQQVINQANEILNQFQKQMNENNIENVIIDENKNINQIIIKDQNIRSNNLGNNNNNNNNNDNNMNSNNQGNNQENDVKNIDIVIGMAQKTDPKNLVVFCASLRKHSNAELVLFVSNPISDLSKKIIEKYKVNAIPFNLEDLPQQMRSFHPSTYRWYLIYHFFQKNANKYRNVWMIDVRDSYFQSDPFAIITSNPSQTSQFHVFQGVDMPIGQCGWNGPWISDCFGNEMLQYVGPNTIICSGVSVGTIDVVSSYLSRINSILEGNTIMPYITTNKYPTCERNGVDQGIHNVLVYTNQIKNMKIWSQSNSPVLNLQSRSANVQGNIVKNLNNEIAAVVHQYDRYPDLQKQLFKEYVDWVDTSDPMAEWNQEIECTKYDYVFEKDLFKGKCDYKIKGGATGPSSCCGFCNEFSECAAFTFYNGQCFLKTQCGKPSSGPYLQGAVSGYKK